MAMNPFSALGHVLQSVADPTYPEQIRQQRFIEGQQQMLGNLRAEELAMRKQERAEKMRIIQQERNRQDMMQKALGNLSPQLSERLGIPAEQLGGLIQSGAGLEALGKLGSLMAGPDIDLQKNVERIALKQAQGIPLSQSDRATLQAYENIKRSEIDYDPNTGQARPKYRPILNAATQQQLGVDTGQGRMPTPQQAVEQGVDFFEMNNIPSPQKAVSASQQFNIPTPPAGLFPKAQLEWQTQAIKQGFEERAKTKEQREARGKFETLVGEVANHYKNLEDMGALPQHPDSVQDYAKNPMRYLAATENVDPWGVLPAGQDIGRLFATKAQAERDKINTKTPALFSEIRTAAGLTGKELDNIRERDFYLQQLGKLNLPYPVIKDILATISRRYGTGEFEQNIMNAAIPETGTTDDVTNMTDQQLEDIIRGN